MMTPKGKTLCCALALACIATGTACQQANATGSNAKNTATIRTTTTANPNARSLQLERSVYDMSHRANMYHLLNKR